MSHNRLLILAIAAAVVVACGGDEQAGFSDVDAAAEARAGQAGSSGHGGNGAGGSAGTAGNDTTGGASGAPSDGGPADSTTPFDSDTDAATADGAGGTASDAGSGATGGSAGDLPDAPVDGCSRPTVYYADKDKDGHGSAATSIVACSPPAGTWVTTATDCHDTDSRVHPGQAAYFAVAYRAASGNSSFDYDCSGSEDEDPSQTKATANCGLLSLALCAGSGYAETARVGQGLSPYCGSSELRECRAALGILLCESVVKVADEPFRCR